MKLSRLLFPILAVYFYYTPCFAQAGISASPAKMYYRIPSGGTGSQKVTISNPNRIDLDVGVSMGDWNYDSLGVNNLVDPGTLKISCADWIQVFPGSFFTILPDERKELEIVLNVPANADKSIPVRTAMLYFTQLNAGDAKAENGAAIKVSVRMGIKVYHSFTPMDERNVDIINFVDQQKTDPERKPYTELELKCENTGKIWLDGTVQWELLNTKSGEKIKLTQDNFLSLPGDKRTIKKILPPSLKRGVYAATATINYGNKEELKIAELEFEY
ncbi:MAG: hypothetical protein V4687_00110 [Bacteroidota bacterium]